MDVTVELELSECIGNVEKYATNIHLIILPRCHYIKPNLESFITKKTCTACFLFLSSSPSSSSSSSMQHVCLSVFHPSLLWLWHIVVYEVYLTGTVAPEAEVPTYLVRLGHFLKEGHLLIPCNSHLGPALA